MHVCASFMLTARKLASAIWLACAAPVFAQSPPLAFDAASVKPSRLGVAPVSNFPLTPDDAYVPGGGFFNATGFSLATYVFFAYQIQGNQGQTLVPQLPGWVFTDRFDIQARAPGNPTKDEMRLMMRALLADRFHLAMHKEVRTLPVLAAVLAKTGKPGPQLRPHSADPPCASNIARPRADQTPQAFPESVPGGFPAVCKSLRGVRPETPGHIRAGARDVTIEFLMNYLSGEGTFGRPVIDGTELAGTYDFVIEWAPQGRPPPGSDFKPDPAGPTFEQAIRDQLGLKFESRQSALEIIVVDRVERPSAN